jgi:electron transfer flavoprotein beta subunit
VLSSETADSSSEVDNGVLIVAALKWAWLRMEVDSLTGAVRVGPHDGGVSAADWAALEHALRLAEVWGGRVVAVTCGPAESEPILRDALAAGASEAMRINIAGQRDSGGELAAATLVGDGRRVAKALATAVRNRFGRPDLVLCGDRSVDRGTGTVPGFLAAELTATQALGVVRLRAHDTGLLAHRRLDHGRREVLRVGCPAVVSVEAAGVRLRRAPLSDVIAARHAAIPVSQASIVDSHVVRVLGSGRYRPHTRPLVPPQGPPSQRLLALTGALSDSTPARVVGPLPPAEAVNELLAYLQEHGYG